MTRSRVSATFDRETLFAIRRVAGRRGVSGFLQIAARELLTSDPDDLSRLLAREKHVHVRKV
jgi:hypothetical protein